MATADRSVRFDDLHFTDLTKAIGSEVHGIDLARPIPEDVFAAVRRRLADRSMLLFRGQSLTPEAQIAFSRRLGPLEEHVLSDFLLPGHPEVFVVSNIVENGRHIGAFGGSKEFHSDLAYLDEPSLGSVFRCLECPAEGGETAFASMFAAWDALPGERRRWLEGRLAVYDYVWSYEARHKARKPLTDAQKAKLPPVAHPAVRTHPENGRRALFLSHIWVRRFEGMGEAESQRIVRELVDFATGPEFTYVHAWRPGDVVVWDNRSSMHKACPFDETGTRRLMHRTTIRGDRPFLAA